MEQDKRYEPEVSFDFSSLQFNWEEYADQCNREDGGHSVAIAEYLFNTEGILPPAVRAIMSSLSIIQDQIFQVRMVRLNGCRFF
jgi:hypothetical protein